MIHDRFLEAAEALERLEKLRLQPNSNYPNFLHIEWPKDEGGGSFDLTYGDLGTLFRAVMELDRKSDSMRD